jgi:hypothetical protein
VFLFPNAVLILILIYDILLLGILELDRLFFMLLVNLFCLAACFAFKYLDTVLFNLKIISADFITHIKNWQNLSHQVFIFYPLSFNFE